ncbi:MAG: beta-ketoacyl-ACP synthase II, partial [Cytophagales bacterium]|nr:beta-ketoacyl-ACP synthase II [Cytophagales bacterium]
DPVAVKLPHLEGKGLRTVFGCPVKDYIPKDHFPPKELKRLDRYSQFALLAAEQAMKDAFTSKEEIDKLNKDRCGVIWGTGIGGIQSTETEVTKATLADSDKTGARFDPFYVIRMISNIAGGYIAIRNGFKGINLTTVSACSSSANAIIEAAHYIEQGKADLILSGGSEAALSLAGIGGFNAMKALSTRNDDPGAASRPFDRDRDGFVLGEGGAALILEDYEHAKKRNAHIYAFLSGKAVSCDAFNLVAPHPEGIGAIAVMKGSLDDASLNPKNIDYINAHGTSTPVGDGIEIEAIKTAFGKDVYKLNISSTKSVTGHLLGAAGALESIVCLQAIEHQIVPPTINTQNIDLDPKINYTLHKAQSRNIQHVMSNSFGFGGHNATIIFSKLE